MRRLSLAFIASLVTLTSCQITPTPAPEGDAGRVAIPASIYPIAYLAGEVGGSFATVSTLTPSGAEPHAYEPTARDMVEIARGDLLLLNGSGLEPWGARVEEQLRGGRTSVVTLGAPLATLMLTRDGAQVPDPHVWLDPMRAAEMGQHIADELSRIDPSHADAYAANARSLRERLTALDTSFRDGLRTCALREIVTTHAAFGYLTDRYQITQIPISGFSPEEEPSAKQIAEVATLVRQKGISTIFFEELVSPRLAEPIAKEAGATTLVLDPIEGMSEEAQTSGESYISQMETNLANLRVALQCTGT